MVEEYKLTKYQEEDMHLGIRAYEMAHERELTTEERIAVKKAVCNFHLGKKQEWLD